MKKIKKILMMGLCLGLMSAAAFAKAPLRIYLDNEKLQFSVAPTIEQGSTMVPFKAIFEKLGFTVTWEASTRTITALKEDMTIKMTLDENTVLVNEELKELPMPPKIIRNTTFVPLKMISEIAGKEVQWDSQNYRVLIGNKDFVPTTELDYAAATTPQAITFGKHKAYSVQFEDGFEIALGPKVKDTGGKHSSYIVIVKNNTGFPVEIKRAKFTAKQGTKKWDAVLRGIKVIDMNSVKNIILQPGETKTAYVTFMTVEPIAQIHYADPIHETDLISVK